MVIKFEADNLCQAAEENITDIKSWSEVILGRKGPERLCGQLQLEISMIMTLEA